MAGTKTLGTIGEELAIRFLKGKGYAVLDKNFSYRPEGSPQAAEIDIIAQKDHILHFVEVKTITQKAGEEDAWMPEEKVNYGKQRKIAKAAEIWMNKRKVSLDRPYQIDVVAIVMNKQTQKASIRFLENVGWS
ncbi:MAG: hypothetical protein A3E07_01440 [Candidatus Wildermuthbacteria bacterium RIFCSPHIGHO2_12_FULL_45_9]|uniref:UPF0102 protein A3C04_02590 n=1 Tax=Candidatus Wildermuthbacteria bacterium RIFCSPHIGHO2_02_FULL_45_25 TaxID=1802450 RepID=A0A1G2R2T4_9BACT|nr:MAG: hypothetical protein A2748_01945 [Candidatus Wildermuthbacteria bacterium RIFCSPHIGHO2_01_FULL_45_20]OHA67175.1 MAG: hypothetical protein A3C04_02590 [Candidatus Wildermuthbacteria bacterium RIFCSPHIGHO2_02_FULL_45_25]OHA71335.1 MAG: hypothetical protein A3E07_01440 [Candidatus Wildermuthbacteria bacterium RIFCSPHIGHO2_12_FULL_45_9]